MELRSAFAEELRQVDAQVRKLYALVIDGLAGATEALLVGDKEAARELVARDTMVDRLYLDVEDVVQRQFALQAPLATDLRFLLSVLRMVPELERSGDLTEHIAQRAARGITSELTPRVRGLIEQMGRTAVGMWAESARAYDERDPTALRRLASLDDGLDDLHVSFITEVAGGSARLPVAIELALLGRFYERLGDHAVNLAARLGYMVTGSASTKASQYG